MGTWELQQFPCSGHCMWNVVVVYVIDIFCKTCTDVTSQFIGVMSVTWLTLDPGDAAPPVRPALPVCNGRYQLIYELCQAGTQHRLRGEERLGAAGTHTCKVCWEASLSNTDKYQQWKIGKLGKNWWPRTFILRYQYLPLQFTNLGLFINDVIFFINLNRLEYTFYSNLLCWFVK